ncbi:family 43 glycosylhydrolase [Nakamurella sp.]|uniref:glycoside hydrolase family 43 protein n=1 Tax=Nakamurella sp. TaxID=1869182 RepID=UPI003B3B9A6F
MTGAAPSVIPVAAHTTAATRPVIPGFHPDPSICRVGDTYYLAVSSFEYAPGVPLFASTDLRTWRPIGHALDRPGQLDVAGATAAEGIFAPTLRHHDGRFWMITTNWWDKGGQVLVHATDPAGPWSDPVRIPEAVGIDPDLVWDDDGRCLMSYAGFGPQGSEGIVQSEIDPWTGAVRTPRRRIWAGTGGKFPEGPHLYRVGDHWYLLIAEGGTERGHAVTVARSRSPQGPFESCPHNPLLTHRSTDLPVQNTGHADLVQVADGSWAMVFHGVRPRGSSPEWHVLGRETFAVRIEWVDGWPVLGAPIEPPPGSAGPVPEDLSAPVLPDAWVGCGRFPTEFVSRQEDGWRVSAVPAAAEPVFLARRQEHLTARVRAALTVVGVGGLSIRIDPRHALTLECVAGTVRAVLAVGDARAVLGSIAVEPAVGDRAGGVDALAVDLEIRAMPAPGHAFSTSRGPDRVVAGVRRDGGFVELGAVDGRYLSTEVAGGMTGRMVGITCADGHVLVRSFEYLGSDDDLFADPAAAAGRRVEGAGAWTTDLVDSGA